MKTLKDVSGVGDELVKQLGEAAEHNLLVRWMAEHLADLLQQYENASGEAKQKLAAQCSDIILKIWSHRHHLPSGARPLESFEALFQTLQQLSQDTSRYPMVKFFDKPETREDEGVLGAALAIDRAAASLIRYSLAEITAALAKKNKRWAEVAKSMSSTGRDIQIVFRLTEDAETLAQKNARLRKEQIEDIEEMIERLALLEKKAPALRKHLEARLNSVKRK